MPSPVHALRSLCPAVLLAAPAAAQEQRFARTDSASPYVHHLELRDERHAVLYPQGEPAPPYSPEATCGKCHDFEAILRGDHFHAGEPVPGRVQEPWFLVDPRTGTQIPLSESAEPGTFSRRDVALSDADFVRAFGRYLPAWLDPGEGWVLPADCMLCHDGSGAYSFERRAAALEAGQAAAAATVALGLGTAAAGGDAGSAGVRYDPARFDAGGKVFFDVSGVPPDRACLFCHSTRRVLEEDASRWLLEEDVHTSAGMRCGDCHRMDGEHHTVRGYEGEEHPSGLSIASLTCRGCHLGSGTAGAELDQRAGAPFPEHRGLPPVHLERMSCTACHSGPLPAAAAFQLARAHALGFPSQTRTDQDLPLVRGPFFRRDATGVLAPVRAVWPAFFGSLDGEHVTPLPAAAQELRSVLRVRRDLARELPDPAAFREKLAAGLLHLEQAGLAAAPVYVSAGKRYQRDATGELAVALPAEAAAVFFPLAHDVRAARSSLGSGGCTDCHAPEAAFAHGQSFAAGPAPDESPLAVPLLEETGVDARSFERLEQSFAARGAFKVVLWTALVLAAWLLIGRLPPVRSGGTRTRWILLASGTVLLVAVLVLAATALSPVTGVTLLLHLAASGVFLAGALVWMAASLLSAPSASAGQRALRWLALASGIAATLPVALALHPWFSTGSLRALLSLHGTAGVLLTGAVLLAAVVSRISRRG